MLTLNQLMFKENWQQPDKVLPILYVLPHCIGILWIYGFPVRQRTCLRCSQDRTHHRSCMPVPDVHTLPRSLDPPVPLQSRARSHC